MSDAVPHTTFPTVSAEQVAANLSQVRERIADAAARAGRRAEDVTLVAVSKTHPAAAIEAAIAAGQLCFGENRVQEANVKFAALRSAHPAVRLHIIGGLQTNKTGDAVRIADVIESLDRPKLADAIAAAVRAQHRTLDLLVQVNTGDEAQKSGVSREAADDFITACRDRFGASLSGLMCIPPIDQDPAPHFAWLADRAARHGLMVLSMGMSGDFDVAIAYGATHVRIGTAIFGQRDYKSAATK
jgi:pyridoxal phosphate enzyme (YggS family)